MLRVLREHDGHRTIRTHIEGTTAKLQPMFCASVLLQAEGDGGQAEHCGAFRAWLQPINGRKNSGGRHSLEP